MDMFQHYYDEVDDDMKQLEMTENERTIVWAVKDFADACERYGFLHMGEELVAEFRRRQERKQTT